MQSDAIALLLDRIIPALERNDHSEKESFLELMSDIEAFQNQIGRANRAKYDRDYFEDKWDI